jgi:hypothetical protein
MTLRLDIERFEVAHQAFLAHMLKQSGTPFTSFSHEFLWTDEIAYKIRVSEEAREILQVDRWSKWRKEPGRILRALETACSPRISRNLLEHRFGRQKPFAKARSVRVRNEFESGVYDLFVGGPTPTSFAPRFDRFADCLRENRLGCSWPFVAYLAFLVSPRHYFPIRPSRFQRLLDFYRLDAPKLAGHVSWNGYQILVDLVDVLRERLLRYGGGTAIEIQSYMWVVAYLIERRPPRPTASLSTVNFADELMRREAAARNRERIGVAGEELVYHAEKAKLVQAGRQDLARRVTLVSRNGDESGYDILSFESNGDELHIEVKTTTASIDGDSGFWLSDAERRVAATDNAWTVYRVWEIDLNPHHQNVGNVTRAGHGEWELVPWTWFVRRR